MGDFDAQLFRMQTTPPQPDDDECSESVPLQIGPQIAGVRQRAQLWTPYCLSLSYFVAFIVLLSVLAISLGALFAVSEDNEGIVTSQDDLHYLWTYGPTAVFTIVAALWAPVDFRTRQLTPWKNMMGEPTPSRASLFLDYLSPWTGLLLWSSLRNRHFAVSLGLTGKLLSQLLIVLSTGLLVLQSVSVQDSHAALIALDSFSGEDFSSAVPDIRQYQAVSDVQNHGSKYPLGTSTRFAYQTFNSSRPVNGSITSVVDVFHMDVSCNVLLNNVTIPGPANPRAVQKNETFTINGSTNLTLSNLSKHIKISTPDVCVDFRPSKYTGDDFDVVRPPPLCDTQKSGAGSMLLEGRLDLGSSAGEYQYYNNTQFTTVYCSTGYGISPIEMTINEHTKTLDAVLSGLQLAGKENKTLPGVTADDILGKVLDVLWQTPLTTDDKDNDDAVLYNFVGLFAAMSNANPEISGPEWLNGTLVAAQAENMITAVAAQVAKSFLMVSAHEPLKGMTDRVEERILVRKLSFGTMEATLGAFIVITIALSITVPRSVCSRDPGSIAGLATIMAANDTVTQSFKGTGSLDVHDLAQAGASKTYKTQVILDSRPCPQFALRDTDGQPLQIKDNAQRIQWWRPFPTTAYAHALVFGYSVSLIIALEILYQYSQRHSGITSVASNFYSYYAWVYVPSFTVFGITTLYSMVDDATRLFQPYSVLRRRAAPAHPLLFTQYLGKPALKILWDSLRYQDVATVSTTVAVLLGGLLPIAVSGLFTPVISVENAPVHGSQVQSFSSVINFIAGSSTPSLILWNNVSYPAWTYEDLAFPKLRFPPEIMNSIHENDKVTVQTPAARAKINCTSLNQDQIKITDNDGKGVHIDVTVPLRFSYSPSSPNYHNNSNWNYLNYPYGYFGEVQKLGIGIWNIKPNGPIYAPIYGYADKTGSKSTVSLSWCYPYFETVETITTFNLPDFTIDATNPPTVQPNSANAVTPIDPFEDRFINLLSNITLTHVSTKEDFDEVFTAMVWGIDGTPVAELLNNDVLQSSLQRVYGLAQAQRIREGQMQKWNKTTAPEPVRDGTLHRANQARLVQNEISTRILEALLAGMLVCAGVAFVTVTTRRVLPKNPCSIGAQISLLAGSDIATRKVLAAGSEWWDDDQLKSALDGWLFSMGWWNRGERFGIGIGKAEQDQKGSDTDGSGSDDEIESPGK
ncbi:uncharacterized protein PFLUO_LOCUS7338 [Penicillium psychrofluorescens]|uniref:uncharacterized protein n=1 Tax=Penicillium psychrofluorescens TaxID=3158075 RepID=UPI003CCD80F2